MTSAVDWLKGYDLRQAIRKAAYTAGLQSALAACEAKFPSYIAHADYEQGIEEGVARCVAALEALLVDQA